MSIICCKQGKGWILNHAAFIKDVYTTVNNGNYENPSFKRFALNENIFEIFTPFLYKLEAKTIATKKLEDKNIATKIKRRTKRSSSEHSSPSFIDSFEVMIIKSCLEDLLLLAKELNYFLSYRSNEDFISNNEKARDCSALFFDNICQNKLDKCNGGNSSEVPILVHINGHSYLIPNNSRFFCCDIFELFSILPPESKFDFILMDPPWWNKYVRRRKRKHEKAGYKMMYNEEVASLPVEKWLAPSGLVAVWCTNCIRHFQDIVNHWFPKWGLNAVATWYWVKVTRSGELVCPFSPPPGKQPYERIIFGSRSTRTIPQPPDNQCIVSIPSAIHSHKPPLVDVMKPFLPDEAQCLELFARYLLPNWTSAGDQVLTLQNVQLFTEVH